AHTENTEQRQQGAESQHAIGGDGQGRRRRAARVLDRQVGSVINLRLGVLVLLGGVLDDAVNPAALVLLAVMRLRRRGSVLGLAAPLAGPGGGLLVIFRAGNDEDMVAFWTAHFLAGNQRLGRLEGRTAFRTIDLGNRHDWKASQGEIRESRIEN